MPDQTDAEVLQILGRQARQYPCVDLVRAERRLVLLEPEAPQPFPDIHRRHAPSSDDRSVLRFRGDCQSVNPFAESSIDIIACLWYTQLRRNNRSTIRRTTLRTSR